MKSGPFLIYLTARSPERGAEAVDALHKDPELRSSGVLALDGGETTIKYQALDISEPASKHQFAEFLQKEHPEGIDFFINNAGIAMEGFDSSVVKETLATNYFGTLEVNSSVLPLLRPGGRLVNVTSRSGLLNKYSDEVRNEFLSAAKTSISAVTQIMHRFQSAVDEGKEKEAGFPSAAYAVSKAGATAYTKVLATEEAKRNRGVLVNACCPGYVNTDMTKGRGKKTVDEGAKTPVMLALSDIGGKTGEFWYNEEVTEW